MFIRVAVLMFALQFGQLGPPQATAPRSSNPTIFPDRTPPIFANDSYLSTTIPPDTSPPSPTDNSNSSVERWIRTALSNERRLERDSVDVTVSNGRVMLDGEVLNHYHRYVAIQIAIDYAGTRTLVDHLRLSGER